MRRLYTVFLCALLPSVAPAATSTENRAIDGNPQTTGTVTLRVEHVRELRKGVDAWPMIVSPSGPAEQRINATLTGLNQRLAQALRNCDEGYGWALKQMGDLAKGQYPVSKDWSRRVKVTMTGPHFFSLVATENAFCGGAHPDSGQMAMVFDITTGAEVDWTTLAAKSAEPSTYSDTVMDGSTMNALVLPALRLLSVASANSDCKDVFRNPQSYLIWPDAMRETLVAQPFDLPHVVQACANEIVLTIEQARKLGFDQGLLDAIQQAHHQTVIAPER